MIEKPTKSVGWTVQSNAFETLRSPLKKKHDEWVKSPNPDWDAWIKALVKLTS